MWLGNWQNSMQRQAFLRIRPSSPMRPSNTCRRLGGIIDHPIFTELSIKHSTLHLNLNLYLKRATAILYEIDSMQMKCHEKLWKLNQFSRVTRGRFDRFSLFASSTRMSQLMNFARISGRLESWGSVFRTRSEEILLKLDENHLFGRFLHLEISFDKTKKKKQKK